MSQTTLSKFDATALVALAKRNGLSSLESLQPLLMPSASPMLDAKHYCRIYQDIMRNVEDETVGLFMAGPMPPGAFKHLCYVVLSCKNLLHAMRRMAEFYDFCRGPILRPKISEVAEGIWVEYETTTHSPYILAEALEIRRDLTGVSLLVWQNLLSWWSGSEVTALAFSTFDDDLTELGPQMRRDRFRSAPGLLFAREMLDRPIVRDAAELQQFLQLAPIPLLQLNQLNPTVAEKVLQRFRVTAPRMESMESIAAHLGMSVASLRRALDNESTRFRALKEQTQRDWAMTLIQKPELSLSEIADTLGFSELSNFHRKFKQWTGETPSSFREFIHAERK